MAVRGAMQSREKERQLKDPAPDSLNSSFWKRRILLMFCDCVVISLSGFLALLTRFEFSFRAVDPFLLKSYATVLPWWLLLMLFIFWLCHLYSSLWEYASVPEMLNVLLGVFFSELALACLVLIFSGVFRAPVALPRSFYPISFFYNTFFVAGLRISYRMMRQMRWNRTGRNGEATIMIIGAGAAGSMVANEVMHSSFIRGRVACFVDDDTKKIGNYIHGIRVAGSRKDIPRLAEKYGITQIIIAMPSQQKKTIRDLLQICNNLENVEIKILPGIYQLVNSEVSISELRDVQIEDLLGRDPIQVDYEVIGRSLRDKVVLVTGGGGSIGSELCRQIMKSAPRQLIILDIYENSTYEVQQELKQQFPDADLKVLIGSVRNTNRVNEIFEKYRPQIVFHAAAHKHVPLMEDSPEEAVKNNVFGTLKMVRAASTWGAERFVLISTDKAVNPTNVMGATKRLCEMIIQTWDRHSTTEYVAVRFGNVLGSNGSVIPLFEKQISQGGPVTVTHPDIVRYFMTIPEAVGLILTAMTYAKGGEIFVLDMGEPVKIDDLARNMIRLSGLKVGEDIDIVYTGLRPGEKLYEELLMSEEGLQKTKNELVYVAKPIQMNEDTFEQELQLLEKAVLHREGDVRELLKKIVPTYHPENVG